MKGRVVVGRVVGLVVAGPLLVLGGGCGDQSGPLPSGTFSGSMANRQAITIEITGREVEVEQTDARLLANGTIEARELPGDPTLKCEPREKGDELRCILRRGKSRETVELMRI